MPINSADKKCIVREIQMELEIPNLAGTEKRLFFLSKAISCSEYKISNPLTHPQTATLKRRGDVLNSPETAKKAPMEASQIPTPKTK